MFFESSYIHTDVTAVSIYRSNIILAGIGSYLNVYSTISIKPVTQRLLCLRGQKIYGFKESHERKGCFIVFGGKQFTVVAGPDNPDDSVVFTRLFEPVVCDDWLHSVEWTPGEVDSVSVLTAHNVVQTYNTQTLSLVSQQQSPDNSILYSGLLLGLQQDLLVLAGTVYSEVIIHIAGDSAPLQRLKGHKGVIFSISCSPERNIIVTTSDDRSVRIWGPHSLPVVPWNSSEYWKNEIVCKQELYGHSARVMRSDITDKYIASVGEDSHICFWSYKGVLLHKVKRHQNGGIWSIKAHGPFITTGGGDGAVNVQNFSPKDDHHQSDMLNLNIGKPKYVAYSANHNLYILNERNIFIYYDVKTKTKSMTKLDFEFDTTFHSFCVSPCRQMCAVAGRKSVVVIAAENIWKPDVCSINFSTIMLEDELILSVHWAATIKHNYLVVTTEGGNITVLIVSQEAVPPFTKFELPNCKERWLTCAAMDSTTGMLILGDRCGSIHLYRKGVKLPLKSYSKVHGRYGPTSITIVNDKVITTGRDKTIRYFKINDDELTAIGSTEVDFQWIEKFLSLENKLICGFKEKMFVMYNLKSNENMLEITCGGGHRSWDAMYFTEGTLTEAKSFLKLVYIKNSCIKIETLNINAIAAISMKNGSHCKDIHCLKTFKIGGRTIFVSGGEDTTLRISSLDKEMYFEDLAIFKHLSSVRTLRMHSRDCNDILLITGGGRAQISIKILKLNKTIDNIDVDTRNLIDFMVKGTDKERKGVQHWKNVSAYIDPETRIMDVDFITSNDNYTIFAGCSDACVRVFTFKPDLEEFKMINESSHPRTCILKTICINFLQHDILITCSTRGEVAFWDVTNMNSVDNFKPFFEIITNKSGINSFTYTNLPENRILIVTGGDDNAVHLNVVGIHDQVDLTSMQVLYSLVLNKHHSSAITGLCFIGDFILSTSIDQRITLYDWKVTDKIECNFACQFFSDVADIKGLDIISVNSSSISVCVYGKGIEIFDIPLCHSL